MASGPITSWPIDWETMETVRDYFGGLQNHCRWWLQPWNQKTLAPWKKSYDQPRQHIKKQRYYFTNKGPSSQDYGFSSSHVWMWELDCKESWVPKNWCFWTVVLEKTLESPSGFKKIQPVHPKGNQSWIFIGRTNAEVETPILWPPAVKNWLIGKDPDAGKDWKREEKQMTEDEMVGWHHRHNGCEFEWALGVDDGQGGLACCSPCHNSATELMLVPWLWQIFQETTWEWTHKQPGYQSLDVLSKVSPGWFSSPRSAIVMFVCLYVNSAYFLSCSLFNHH